MSRVPFLCYLLLNESIGNEYLVFKVEPQRKKNKKSDSLIYASSYKIDNGFCYENIREGKWLSNAYMGSLQVT